MANASFVIVSQGRASLRGAIESAIWQRDPALELIVVDTSGDAAVRPLVSHLPQVQYAETQGAATAAAGRQLGCALSKGAWVALLDDDDLCSPERLRAQISFAERRGLDIVSTDYFEVPYEVVEGASGKCAAYFDELCPGGGPGLPKRKPAPSEDMAGYLFRRRSVMVSRRLVTSSLLVSADYARSIPWQTDMRRFEDWAWLMHLRQKGAVWGHLAQPLVAIGIGAPRSLSQGALEFRDAEVEWAARFLSDRPRELGDVLCCDVAVPMVKSGRPCDALRVWRRAREVGKPGVFAQARLLLEVIRSVVAAAPLRRSGPCTMGKSV